MTSLFAAALWGRLAAVTLLLGSGAQPLPQDGLTPLYAAARFGRLRVVKALLPRDKHKDEAERERLLEMVERRDSEGLSALVLAVVCGSASVVEYLLRREKELLKPLHRRMGKKKVRPGAPPEWDRITVYQSFNGDSDDVPLSACVVSSAGIADTLLDYMLDPVLMRLAAVDAQAVRRWAARALRVAAKEGLSRNARLVRVLCKKGLGAGGDTAVPRAEDLKALRTTEESQGRNILRSVDTAVELLGFRLAMVLQEAVRGSEEVSVRVLAAWLAELVAGGAPGLRLVLEELLHVAQGILGVDCPWTFLLRCQCEAGWRLAGVPGRTG
ncbi:hypothetical protein ONE63_000074 [Megalurothrips usitatus]|uniref:Uncharacterized protein n=1 Tax=Megalurothrips usitatus TaxID=439358 RepID=A0AAV7Y0D4_9NEOP|nr:hypothetical protein ONE63_000074 [Megalurothrips usitatus]